MVAHPNTTMSEAEFLAAYDPGEYERPSVAVDVVLLAVRDGALWTVGRARTQHPNQGAFGLPGGFIGLSEDLDTAAARVIERACGWTGVWLEQLYTFGAVDRDPRMRVISVVYYALVHARRFDGLDPSAIAAQVEVPWTGVTAQPVVLHANDEALAIAFDHATIIGQAVARLRGKLDYAPLGLELVPEQFTLRELREVHEVVLGHALNKDSFRRKVLASGMAEPTGEMRRGDASRPAQLYRRAR